MEDLDLACQKRQVMEKLIMSDAMKNMSPVFNYGDIKKEHRDAAVEIAQLLDQMNLPMAAELIKEKFKLVEKEKYAIDDHEFVQACKHAEIFVNIQGHLTDNGIEYPVIMLADDFRKFSNLYNIIKNV